LSVPRVSRDDQVRTSRSSTVVGGVVVGIVLVVVVVVVVVWSGINYGF
jgi:tetrahydromethanopterin S-methyltransferase subunit F